MSVGMYLEWDERECALLTSKGRRIVVELNSCMEADTWKMDEFAGRKLANDASSGSSWRYCMYLHFMYPPFE